MITTTSAGWKVTRVKGVEVFTSPEGGEFIRCGCADSAEVTVQFKTTGLPPLYLRARSAESIVKAAERKERRQERRDQARRNRKKGT